ncbi:sugar ABC transporter substrate-binding protein [Paracoccus liaowanqingii]|uniref:Sugar ABC transporter substrate-binding protein n=2 Tax=Paracoccus liaowanqingii TaxID=2560053 RepID=A0A4P7HLJ0_9RHOB|nr:substrate-binding domain-containing protein [Paracoccus liaowanqingii]QBX35094.1 sugar ABC transporter substrate-binding protein [Paracoccus liaowanqingii]
MTTKMMMTASALALGLGVGAVQAQDDPIKIGMAAYGLNAEFMQLWSAAGETHPAVQSGMVELTIFDGRYDALVQQDQFETMITQGFDAIVFAPMDVEAGATAVQLAVDAGIPVVGSNARVNSDLLTAYVGSNDVEAGYLEAKAVLDKMGCTGDVVIIEGPIGQSGEIQRGEGNEQALAECPDVSILERQTGNWSRAEAQALMENWLTSHGENIKGVIAQNDEMALGAIEAIKAAGMDVSDFAIAGVDGVTDALNAVKSGEMDSILQDGEAQALGSIDVAIKAVRPDYEPMADIWEQYPEMPWNDGASKEYNVPWTPVTADNVDDLLAGRQ